MTATKEPTAVKERPPRSKSSSKATPKKSSGKKTSSRKRQSSKLSSEESPKGPSREPSQGRRNKELGRRGEEAAARFLSRNGYRILERNWTCFAGEADIIALNDEALVFVEVKTRRGVDYGLPSESVTRAKREKYERIAMAYIQDHFFGEAVVRFDVVSIVVLSGDRAFVRHHLGAYSAGA